VKLLRVSNLTVITVTATTVFSVGLMFQCGLVLQSLDAQSDVTSPTDNDTSGNQDAQAETGVGTYIIALKNQSSSADLDDIIKSIEQKGASVTHIYNYSINGFSIQIPVDKKTEIMYSLLSDMRISSVEPDQTMTLSPPLK
jgi:Peptidase inhibitor I9